MRTAYDPARISALSHRTAAAIDALAAIRSSDPEAMNALRSVSTLRRNLEEHWMPLLREIQMSRAMIDWTTQAATAVRQSYESVIQWLDDLPSHYATMSTDELLELVLSLDDDDIPYRFVGDTPVLDRERWDTNYFGLAEEMSLRVRSDPEFAAELIEWAFDRPAVGIAIGIADFPVEFMGDVATSMLHNTHWYDKWSTVPESVALSMVLSRLAASPLVCLDILQDDVSLYELVGAPLLDAQSVASFFQSGLHDSLLSDPLLLEDGYRVLQRLTQLAGDAYDGGFQPGASVGIAMSLVAYIDTLAPAINGEGRDDVRIKTQGDNAFAFELGTYDQLVDLIGAIGRTPAAQHALGVTIGAYINSIFEMRGSEVLEQNDIYASAEFADLIGDAVTAEQAEMIGAAADETMWRAGVVGSLGTAATTFVGLSGAGAITSAAFGKVVNVVVDTVSHVDPDKMPDLDIRMVAHNAALVQLVRFARSDQGMQSDLGLDEDDPELQQQVDDYLLRLDELHEAGDTEAYNDTASDMISDIKASTSKLGAMVVKIEQSGSFTSLRESHD